VRFPAIEELVGAAMGGGAAVAPPQPRAGPEGADPSGRGRTRGEEVRRAEEDIATRRRTGCSHAEEEGVTRLVTQ
jgi:hypothetical protein